MRILKLPLAGLLFCVMALFAGCKTSNEPKAPVALTWEMGAILTHSVHRISRRTGRFTIHSFPEG